MKIRSGFVSNSSSCSFCIYGIYLSSSDIKKIKKDFDTNSVEGLFKDSLEAHCGNEYDDGLYLGKSWSNIGGEQTGNQFMKEIEDILKDVLKESVKISCSTLEEAWYNG